MSGTVLIVDDSLTVRMDLTEAFEGAGFHTIPCAALAEAREALTRGPVDLVILDVLLPDGDGVEFARSVLRETDGRCRCVLVTGHFEHAELDPELRSAGVQLLYKPFSFLQLYTRIVAHVAKPSEATL